MKNIFNFESKNLMQIFIKDLSNKTISLNVLPDSENPSAEPFVKAQIDSVKALGHDIAIMNVKGSQSKLHYLFAIFKLRKLLKMKNFDLIHGHYVYSGLNAA